MTNINRRKQVRVEAELSVRFADEKGSFVEECIANISKGGVFIETPHPRNVRDVVELFLKVPDSPEEIAIQGEVTHVSGKGERMDEFKGPMGMGIRFIIVEPQQKDVLKRFIDSLIETKGSGTRKHARVYDAKALRVRIPKGKDFKKKIMPNISRGGLFFETDEELTLFDVVDLTLMPEDGGEEFHLASEVVHIRHSVVGEKKVLKGIGVKFLQVDAKKQALIDQFIQRMLDRG
jgi:uncharacterized protein (TIGR02266 family)